MNVNESTSTPLITIVPQTNLANSRMMKNINKSFSGFAGHLPGFIPFPTGPGT